MNILLLGCTSGIGQSITNIFADKNSLILVGRSKNKLEKIGKKAISKGALNVDIIEFDLGTNINDLIADIKKIEIDLLINVASSTSNFRDNDIKLNLIQSDTNVELINPILLIQWLIERSQQLNIIFISSILSKIKSPNRIIYSSFKNLQQAYLSRISVDYSDKINLLTVTIGTEINKNKESKKSQKLAQKLFRAYTLHKKDLYYGFYGKILQCIYNINPFIYKSIIFLKRKIIS